MKHARFTIRVPYRASTGVPTDPTTPDTEFSLDGATFADCAEEVTTIIGSNGFGYITLTGAETNGSAVDIAAKVASGPLTTLMSISPRILPILSSGTASAGGNTSITLGTILAYDITGCIVRTTGGTGGGGTGGANNQARVITGYSTSTGVVTVEPAWETNPSSDTTYDILLTEMACNTPMTRGLRPTTDGNTLDVTSTGEAGLDFNNIKDASAGHTLNNITVPTVTTVGTLTTYTGNTPQTGDAYARIGAAGAGLTAIGDTRIANLDAAVSTRTKPADTQAAVTTVATVTNGVTVTTNNDKTGYALTSGERNSLADSFLIRDWTATVASVGQPADRSSMNALRKLRNHLDTTTLAGSLTVTREDDTTAAYTQILITSGSAQLITSCG